VCSTYTLQYRDHQINYKAVTQRIHTNVIKRDIDCSCVQYIYTTVHITSYESQGGDTEVRYKRNRKRYTLLVRSTYTHRHIEHHMNHKAGSQRLRTNVIERDIDCSCLQYIYTTVYRTSDESQGGDTVVTYIRNRKRYKRLVCAVHIHLSTQNIR
jgi:hypothetical protein